MVEYMKRFGFYAEPQLDYPSDADDRRAASSTARASYVDDGFDIGRVAIGQGGLEGEIAPRRCRWPRWRPRSPTAAG